MSSTARSQSRLNRQNARAEQSTLSAFARRVVARPSRTSRATREKLLALVPGVSVLIATIFTHLNPPDVEFRTLLFWTPPELALTFALILIGQMLANYREMRKTRQRLLEATETEEKRRIISAIGMAANWDLDLRRLYQRVSQDLRSILDFDRFTITSATPTGRMRIAFVSGGDNDDGPRIGDVLPQTPEEPDGLFPEQRARYGSRLTVAIPAGNGTLTIRSHKTNQYHGSHLDLLRQAVAQISPGIANATLYQSSERRLRERTVLADIGRAVTSAADPKEIFEAVDASLSTLIEYDQIGAILVNENDQAMGTLVYWSQPGLLGLNSGDRVPFNGVSDNQGVVTSHTAPLSDGRRQPESGEREWLQAPLIVHDEQIGALIISTTNPDAFGDDESALLLNVSLQIAPAIENANLTSTLSRQSDERRAIAAIGLAANSDLDLDAICQHITHEIANVIEFDQLVITSVADTGDLEIIYTTDVVPNLIKIGDQVSLRDRPAVGAGDEPHGTGASRPALEDRFHESGLNSCVGAGLGVNNSFIGTIHVASKLEAAYHEQHGDLLKRIANQVTPAIRNAQMIAAERGLWETLEKQNKELYEANNARKQFLSTVSHELKTPLTIISGFVDLLMSPDAIDDDAERVETLEIIRRNASQLDVLINDILDISRLDAGTFKIDPVPFNVNDLIADLEASFQSLMRSKTQTLVVNMAEDELWVSADRPRMSQVITNLMSNASKYSPGNTVITLECEVDDGQLHVSVSDHGAGISEEDQAGLFTPFFRADNETTRKVSGTGLGLVIAKSIAELHGGRIQLRSTLGLGTTIEFWIPGLTTREAAEAEDVEEPQVFPGSRLWPEGPPEDIGLGAD